MIYEKKMNSPTYFPPMVGNGDIAFSVDCEGVTNFMAADFGGMKAYSGYIYREGRRLAVLPNYSQSGELFGFGRLFFDEGSALTDWSQELLPVGGFVKSHCEYEDGVTAETESFLLRGRGVYLLQKVFHGLPAEGKDVTFTYTFGSHNKSTNDAVMSAVAETAENGGKVAFRIYGQEIYTGQARLVSLSGGTAAAEDRSVTLMVRAKEGEAITVAFLLEDSMDGADFAERMNESEALLREKGYAALRAENEADWAAYFDEGFVKTPNETLNKVYRTALYHLRSYTTRWSIPVGIYPECWSGKFFAFDEYYSMLGLLEANRVELARRVPEFRARVCLPEAARRMTNGHKPEAALFHWQTSEYAREVGTLGFWNEHIFHMAVVALGAYEFYEYTGNRAFLEECYRMIRACASFYTTHSIYRGENDTYYVGRCTDLERMGPSVLNPFMTACGIIRTLECLVATVDELGLDDKEYRDECEFLARKLRENLPRNEEMYIPHWDCKQKTIGMFSAKYPFNVLDEKDEKMHAAWQDYILNEEKYGNCYAVGKKVSPWYACWKANGFARCHMAKEAYECTVQAFESVGVFGEMYEINEPEKRYRPWFSTAAGVFMSAVHGMLVQSDGETVEILPAYPIGNEDLSFRLSVKGGAVIDVEIKGGELVRADITMREGVAPKSFKIKYKGNFC